MKQIQILSSMLAVVCLLAMPASAEQDMSRGEQDGVTPFFLGDPSAHAEDPLSLAIAEMEGGRYEGAATYTETGRKRR